MSSVASISRGHTASGHEFVPGVNCVHCGRFVGRDGSISIERFEMSSEVAAVEGECSSCLKEADV